MRFELDAKDLQLISRIEYYLCMDDEAPDRLHKGIVKLIEKINNQIPEPIPVGATRRIRVYNKT